MAIIWEPEGGQHLKFQKPTKKPQKTMSLCWQNENQLYLPYCISFKVRDQWGIGPANKK